MNGLRKRPRRKSRVWSRKDMDKRTKEMWHIPKRSSIIQMKGAMEILLDKNLDLNNKKWTGGRKETFNTELAKRGYTESGAPLAQSSRRTFEALLKYLGFIFLDPSNNPPTIRVTEAGCYLLENPTEALKLQMSKLQLTNPVVLEDCIGILVFPFRATLRLLLELGYLSFEEIGYILFMCMKKETDYERVKNEIFKFRKLPWKERIKSIEEFKKTPEGHVALAKAPSVGYYVALCIGTDLLVKTLVLRQRRIEIKKGREEGVKSLLSKFEGAEPYDFDNDLILWIEYYGKPNRLKPPTRIPITFTYVR